MSEIGKIHSQLTLVVIVILYFRKLQCHTFIISESASSLNVANYCYHIIHFKDPHIHSDLFTVHASTWQSMNHPTHHVCISLYRSDDCDE